MQAMTHEQIWAFLLERARTGKLATVRADGRPHIAPVWFDMDGDDLIFTTWHESVKAKNLRRDGRVSLCVDDEAPPFAYAIIEGMATVSEDLDELKVWAGRIAGRYMGAEQTEAYGQRNGVAGELLVRVTPTKMIGQSGVAD